MISHNNGNAQSSGPKSVKLLSFVVLGLVASTFMTSVFPPIFTSSTTRSVTNAPVVPITSPISGRVVSTGPLLASAPIGFQAVIENDRVDRSTLIGLTIELASLQNELSLKRSILDDYAERMAELERDLSRQQAALVLRSDNDLRNAEAHLKMVSYASANEKIAVERKLTLLSKGVVSGTAGELSNTLKLEDAKLEAAKLRVEILSFDLGNARTGIFMGGEQQSLQDLQREIRSTKADRAQINMQAATIETRIVQVQALAAAERERVEKLAGAEVVMEPTSKLFKTTAQIGKQVSAGDTIAEALNCKDAFVVAIFSERQAQNLSIGSPVMVSADGWEAPVTGRVDRLVPRTTERVDLDYAVPFPPTERRELYAYIVPDLSVATSKQAESFCSVGTWVTVSMPQAWFERTRTQIDLASTKVAQQISAIGNNFSAMVTYRSEPEPVNEASIAFTSAVAVRSARIVVAGRPARGVGELLPATAEGSL
ncbi:HlyD family efflux transporter periplasmic adaptor subunit [Ensifer sp. MJa1]|uniref:HlyD family efflux transporter periplasmic adaptor subunit n=1 Tax=Ensifer sp. MJa1 TaxID=2919888 RepID=UPI00300926B1